MTAFSSRHTSRRALMRGLAVVATAGLMVLPAMSAPAAAGAAGPPDIAASAPVSRVVTFHGFRVDVPGAWTVIDLRSHPHACLRLDRTVVYLGHAGDQRACPARVIGGAPGLHLEALDRRSVQGAGAAMITVPETADVATVSLPSSGPVSIAVVGAGVLATAVYGESDAALLQQTLSTGSVLPGARQSRGGSPPGGRALPAQGQSVPGTFRGKGFDACTAPSQSAMDAWFGSSDYSALGIYIGGVNRGCSQPNLTASWVSHQVSKGWHLIPTYVGRQAPCTGFNNRMSYNTTTAGAQGYADGSDGVSDAHGLGIAAPSTLYVDIENYDSTNQACVAAVLAYVSGWVYALHTNGYATGVYSSASSGIHDLSTHYNSPNTRNPDDIWIAWWNDRADVDGGSYVPDSQWRYHQRVHQYVGNAYESHGGYGISIDRDFLDVSSVVQLPRGCPTNLNFRSYPVLSWGDQGPAVVATQCLLAGTGFDPGVASGRLLWRTAAAIRAFKISRGLDSQDSIVRRWAWTALLSAGHTQFLELGKLGPRVSRVQRALTAALQRPIAVTGRFDIRTRDAVRAYQRMVHLDPTGTVGVPTWHALQSGL